MNEDKIRIFHKDVIITLNSLYVSKNLFLKVKITLIHSIFLTTLQLVFMANLQANTAQEYVQEAHDNIVQVILAEQHIYEENPDKFIDSISEVLTPLFDFKRISRNVMGRYYKESNTKQKQSFEKVFKVSLLRTYGKTLAEFQDEEIKVLPEKDNSSNARRAKIPLEIITQSKIYPAIYSMYLDKNSKWKVINIMVNGVNLGLTFRNQFYALMESHNNDVDKVIEEWVTAI